MEMEQQSSLALMIVFVHPFLNDFLGHFVCEHVQIHFPSHYHHRTHVFPGQFSRRTPAITDHRSQITITHKNVAISAREEKWESL
jgi:hypothetical protein